MVWVTGWVSVHSLILVVDPLVVHWLNIVRGVALQIMVNGLVRSSHIVLSHVVVVVLIVMESVVAMVVVNILELHLVVVLAVLVSSVVNLMLGLVVHVLVGN